MPQARREPEPPSPAQESQIRMIFHIDQLSAFQASAGERGGHLAFALFGNVLGVGEIDEMVLREVGMRQDFHQPGQAHGVHRGNARDGIRIELAVAHHAELAVALGHQHVAVGQPRQAPGVPQAGGDGGGFDRGRLGFLLLFLILRLSLNADGQGGNGHECAERKRNQREPSSGTQRLS